MAIAEMRVSSPKPLPEADLVIAQNGHLIPPELNGHRNGYSIELVGLNGNGYFKETWVLQKKPDIFANIDEVPPEWILPLETYYDPAKRGVAEVLGSHGNGKIGRRSSLGRGPNHQHDLFVAGIYETVKPSDNGASVVPDLVNQPINHLVNVYNGHEWFDPDTAELPYYRSYRNMRNGTTIYHIRWKDSVGRTTAMSIEEFISHDDRAISGVRVNVLLEDHAATIAFQTDIDGKVDNNGAVFLREREKGAVGDRGVYYASEAIHNKTITSQASAVSILVDGEPLEREYWIDGEDKRVSRLITIPAEQNRVYTLDNVVVLHSSRETVDPISLGKQKIAQLPSMNTIMKDHVEAVAREWEKNGVKIDGPEDITRAIYYNIGQLQQFAYDGDEWVSIPAKVAGEGYKGHVFWDTEIFMLPFYIHSDPATARSLLMYRYNTLEPAKEKARQHGYQGALYAWESADTGDETTPSKVLGKDGELVDIYTGEYEFHISADIAYAVWEYVKATGDRDFLQNYGAEIIAETGRFWASKAIRDSGEDPQYYHIKRVIGPNEFHELGSDGKPGVDDNFFNNKMAQENLRKVVTLWNEYPSLRDKLGVTEEEVHQWEDIANRMYFPYDDQRDVFDEHEGFKNLELVDRSQYPQNLPIDQVMREHGQHPYKYQMDKQPDVLAGLLLGGERDRQVLEKHWDRYFDITFSTSSLSEPMLALYAARIGKPQVAYELFEKAAMVDINNTKGNTADGVHTATAGGVWWSLVYGFGGVDLQDDRLVINPHVPEQLDGLEFTVRYWGQEVHARIDKDKMHLTLRYGKRVDPTKVEVRGKEYKLMPGEERTFDLREASISSNGYQAVGNNTIYAVSAS